MLNKDPYVKLILELMYVLPQKSMENLHKPPSFSETDRSSVAASPGRSTADSAFNSQAGKIRKRLLAHVGLKGLGFWGGGGGSAVESRARA